LSDLRQALAEAVRLIISADENVTTIVFASLRFSLSSTLLASVIGIPAGIALANARFRFKRFAEDALNTLLAVPTVVVGLFVYTLIFSQGPLGRFQLLFSPAAIILGQTVLILPLVAALACGSVSIISPTVRETALTLGAGKFRTNLAVASEAQAALLVACITAFGRVVGEVGISLILGGNILGYTRTITTAISLQTSKGEFALGLALGIILLCAAFLINVTARLLRRRSR
jgi:tungstate transport system permease protein